MIVPTQTFKTKGDLKQFERNLDESRCLSSKIFHFFLGRETLLDFFF